MQDESSKRILSPIERVAEVLFGLIMVLTFTGSLSAAEAGEAEVRTMLIGAIGCNLAWALIDGIFYLMGCLAEKAANFRAFMAVRRAGNDGEARAAIAETAPPLLAEMLSTAEIDRLRTAFAQMPEAPPHGRLDGRDWLGALGVFLLVFVSTFPVVLPFFFATDAMVALRVSNVIAVAMMFGTGYAFGHLAGYRPLLTGGAMIVLGAALVALTIALGG
ncbi:MAG: VIT1/CCC1 transporter family protein [Hyphomicrobiales bacterium]